MILRVQHRHWIGVRAGRGRLKPVRLARREHRRRACKRAVVAVVGFALDGCEQDSSHAARAP